MSITWDSVSEGDEIGSLTKKPGVSQLVKYAAGSGDFNPLHHDYAFPQSKALGSIIVHGRFKYASLGEAVSNWLGHAGRIRKLSCQYRGMDFPDREMSVGGRVKRKYEEHGAKLVELELWTTNDEGKNTTPGTAIVELNA
ncbi:MAG: MaoC/PaaZ C-terminal domain-containing protein [Myxococcota bacterium]|nr:MaoC/PaaZ C-terminal domain-containing protein [Myxococcota bacterium]